MKGLDQVGTRQALGAQGEAAIAVCPEPGPGPPRWLERGRHWCAGRWWTGLLTAGMLGVTPGPWSALLGGEDEPCAGARKSSGAVTVRSLTCGCQLWPTGSCLKPPWGKALPGLETQGRNGAATVCPQGSPVQGSGHPWVGGLGWSSRKTLVLQPRDRGGCWGPATVSGPASCQLPWGGGAPTFSLKVTPASSSGRYCKPPFYKRGV